MRVLGRMGKSEGPREEGPREEGRRVRVQGRKE